MNLVLRGLLLILAVVIAGCHANREVTEETTVDNYRQRIRQSPNYAGGRFVNEVATNQLEIRELWSAVADNIVPGKDQRPSRPLPIVSVDLSDLDSTSDLKVIWLGHSTVLIQIDGACILTDPVFDDTVAHAIGSTSRFQPPPLRCDSLPAIDYVLISHDHYDHLEQSTVEHLSPTGTIFMVPLGVGRHLRQWTVPDSQIVELDWWESTVFGSLEISCTPARHFSGRSLAEVNKTLWASWVVVGSQYRLFFGGDTGFSDHFERIGDRFGQFDLTLLPIGAFDAAWPDIHIGPEEAVFAHQVLGGEVLLPIHWGTFDLAAHAWDDPIRRLAAAAGGEDVRIIMPRLGEIVNFGQLSDPVPWWEGLE